MQTITLEEAKESYPNMVTVLRIFKPLLKGRTMRVLAQKDVSDVFNIYVDTDVSFEELLKQYRSVPAEIADAEVGAAAVRPIVHLHNDFSDTQLLEVTEATEELWNED